MIRIGAMVSVLAIVLMAGDWLVGQDPKKDLPPPGRGTLPTYYSKLGLSDTQKQQIYAVQAEYGGKIRALRKEISDLQKKEKAGFEKVLTDSQKARLREILTEKAPKDDKKPDTKAPPKEEKKP